MSAAVRERLEYLCKWCRESTWDLSSVDGKDAGIDKAMEALWDHNNQKDPATRTRVRKLHLGGNSLTESCVPKICQALTADSAITSLDLAFGRWQFEPRLCANSVGDGGARLLAQCVPSSHLKELVLAFNQITLLGAQAIAKPLASPKCALATLNLRGNGVGDEGAMALAEALKENKSLKELDLSSAGVTSFGVAALADAARRTTSLRVLDLGWNPAVGVDGAAALAKALSSKSWAVRDLRLARTNLGSAGVTLIFSALAKVAGVCALEKLVVTGCEVTDEAVPAVCQYLEAASSTTDPQQCPLREISLGCNAITDKGATELRDALGRNSSITKCSLAWCPVVDKSILSAIAAITDRNAAALAVVVPSSRKRKEARRSLVLPTPLSVSSPVVSATVVVPPLPPIPQSGSESKSKHMSTTPRKSAEIVPQAAKPEGQAHQHHHQHKEEDPREHEHHHTSKRDSKREGKPEHHGQQSSEEKHAPPLGSTDTSDKDRIAAMSTSAIWNLGAQAGWGTPAQSKAPPVPRQRPGHTSSSAEQGSSCGTSTYSSDSASASSPSSPSPRRPESATSPALLQPRTEKPVVKARVLREQAVGTAQVRHKSAEIPTV